MAVFWDNTQGEDLLIQQGTNAAFSGPASQLTYALNPWDTVFVNGRQIPGICTITAEPKRKHDNQKAAGAHGSQPVFHGYEPAEVSLNVVLWLPVQYDVWRDILRTTIWPISGQKDGASDGDPEAAHLSKKIVFQIYHPALADLGIKSCAVLGPGSLRKGSQPQTMTQTIKMIEYRKIVKKNATKTIAAPAPLDAAFQSTTAEAEAYQSQSHDPAITGGNASPSNATQSLPSANASFTGP